MEKTVRFVNSPIRDKTNLFNLRIVLFSIITMKLIQLLLTAIAISCTAAAFTIANLFPRPPHFQSLL